MKGEMEREIEKRRKSGLLQVSVYHFCAKDKRCCKDNSPHWVIIAWW
ncbi:hypothetical protein HMPREF9999_00649 [Alloprevotella sp. oral taxon 473 str. F0040]|nr:hypothetical protein HMPREF9999_00649 [Alloprevotella sp. oral taxon 473 str. F0040]